MENLEIFVLQQLRQLTSATLGQGLLEGRLSCEPRGGVFEGPEYGLEIIYYSGVEGSPGPWKQARSAVRAVCGGSTARRVGEPHCSLERCPAQAGGLPEPDPPEGSL